jgi:hypothetical protein
MYVIGAVVFLVVAVVAFFVISSGSSEVSSSDPSSRSQIRPEEAVETDSEPVRIPVVTYDVPPVRQVEPLDVPEVKMLAGTIKIPKVSDELKAMREKKRTVSSLLDDAERGEVEAKPSTVALTQNREELVLNNRRAMSVDLSVPTVLQSDDRAAALVVAAQKAAVTVSDEEAAEYASKTISFVTEDSRYFLGVARETLAPMTDGPLLVDDSQKPYVVSVYLTNKQAADFVEKMSYYGATKIETKFRTKPEDFNKKSMFYLRIE